MSSFSPSDWAAIWLTLRLAAVTTVVLIVLGTPLAWWLARTSSRLRGLVETVTALPLVLPPTVLGFYLLILLGPSGPIGSWWEAAGGNANVLFLGLVATWRVALYVLYLKRYAGLPFAPLMIQLPIDRKNM